MEYGKESKMDRGSKWLRNYKWLKWHRWHESHGLKGGKTIFDSNEENKMIKINCYIDINIYIYTYNLCEYVN